MAGLTNAVVTRALLLVVVALCGACNSAPARLRVVTYNIHHGRGTDGKVDLVRIASVIRSLDPDLVALQEVDDRTERSEGVKQAAELGRLTGMHAVFGKAMDLSGGGYGEAVLTRWPTSSHRVHPLVAPESYEPRCALAVTIAAESGVPGLLFVGTHLDHVGDDTVRLEQARRLNELFAAGEEPVILVGDLNDVPGSRTMSELSRRWDRAAPGRAAATYPSVEPKRKIDYVLLRPPGAWRVVETRVVGEEIASDHRPLLVVLEWLGP